MMTIYSDAERMPMLLLMPQGCGHETNRINFKTNFIITY